MMLASVAAEKRDVVEADRCEAVQALSHLSDDPDSHNGKFFDMRFTINRVDDIARPLERQFAS